MLTKRRPLFHLVDLGLALLLLVRITTVCADISKIEWERINIDLSVATLYFSIPDKGGADYSNRRYQDKQINIHDDKIFLDSPNQSYVVFSHLWGFKGHFWQGYTGELLLQVIVQKKNKPEDTFEEYFPDVHKKENVNLNGVGWLKISNFRDPKDQNTLDSIWYATPIIDEHVLIIAFNFIDDSNGKNTKWMKKAQDYMNAIIPTLKIK